jgi:hypothetical protein
MGPDPRSHNFLKLPPLRNLHKAQHFCPFPGLWRDVDENDYYRLTQRQNIQEDINEKQQGVTPLYLVRAVAKRRFFDFPQFSLPAWFPDATFSATVARDSLPRLPIHLIMVFLLNIWNLVLNPGPGKALPQFFSSADGPDRFYNRPACVKIQISCSSYCQMEQIPI